MNQTFESDVQSSAAIKLVSLTKSYTESVGVFDININISSGTVFGFIGPNGAGKSTTIRQIVGFIKPDSGICQIMGEDTWNNSNLMNFVGYVPGELIMPEYMRGDKYLKFCANVRKNVSWEYVMKLIDYFELEAHCNIKKMSKGTKQKVAMIAAFMHKPKVLILDEPTSGLDPLMQEKFIKIINRFKLEGTTIFLSSHVFSEVQQMTDSFSIIKKGKIVTTANTKDLVSHGEKIYLVKFASNDDAFSFANICLDKNWHCDKSDIANCNLKISLNPARVNDFFKVITEFKILSCNEQAYDIEAHFLKYYGDEVNNEF